ncbi:succinate dehydrogenase assembly factor 3, mitochondrial [Topomyia yanbarensis]|uniref:succinate dehydrogenase assembly factor 3, mitochondrial n=1 Tax=Topomyia yanbarensis TaxID=2498891 RepID=UPI00273C756A|nr:succinate dehydrogenase assembly factor 3, mitochondrial [Topomyia yanbarensis]
MCLAHVQRVRILYKTILRLHRGLPKELHSLGNQYVKDEFRRHKTCSNQEASLFMHEWTDYAITLANQLGVKGKPKSLDNIGGNLDLPKLDDFRDEQIAQLYELLLATKGSDEKCSN